MHYTLRNTLLISAESRVASPSFWKYFAQLHEVLSPQKQAFSAATNLHCVNFPKMHQVCKSDNPFSFNLTNNSNKMQKAFISFLECASNLGGLGRKLIRVAILIIFVWIGGLKFANYEANGIIPFVANSPLMSFFLKDANNKVTNDEGKTVKEYTLNKVPEGQYNQAKHDWHVENRTYLFSHGLGILIMTIGILVFLGLFSPYLGIIGEVLCIIMTLGTLSFLITTPETWVHASPEALAAGEWANGFPFLSGAGRLVIKDTAILAGAVVLLSESAGKILARLKK